MKHTFIKFNRDHSFRRFFDAGGTGGNGGGAPNQEKEALLKSIQDKVSEELNKRGYKTESEVQTLAKAAMDTALGGLKLDALRSFDVTANTETLTKLAGAVEKLKQNAAMMGAQQRGSQLNAIKSVLREKAFLDELDAVWAAGPHGRNAVVLTAQRAAVIMTTANTVPAEEIPEDILNSFSVEGFVKKRRPAEYIFNIAARRTIPEITKYKTWLEEGTEDGAFAIVAEGALKPLLSKTLIRNVSEAQKVAGKRVYTEELAKFKKEVYGILEDLFNDQILRNYAAILTTDLIAAAAAYVGTTLDGQYADPTDYHAIGAVAAQIESLDFIPDLLILNPQDKWRIGLQQAGDGHFFVNIPTMSPSGVVSMLGFQVITTNRLTPGTFILGESGLFKIEDEPVTVRMGFGINVIKNVDNLVTDVESDVDHNRFRIIAETYFHDYIATAHAGSFVVADFDDVKEALTA